MLKSIGVKVLINRATVRACISTLMDRSKNAAETSQRCCGASAGAYPAEAKSRQVVRCARAQNASRHQAAQ